MENFEIYAANLEKLNSEIEKSNKLAAKLGCKGTTIELGESFYVKRSKSDERLVEMININVDFGERPSLNGWVFQATLVNGDFYGDAKGTIVKCAPEVEVEEKWHHVDPNHCDHCGHKRARKDTFLVKHEETGEIKQVGRSCMKDFLGHSDPKNFVSYAEYLIELRGRMESGCDYGERGPDILKRNHYLEMVCAMVREDGRYVTRKEASEDGHATADEAWWMIISPPKNVDAIVQVNEEDIKRASELQAWADAWLQDCDGNSYKLNVKAAWESDVVSVRTKGLVGSVFAAHKRDTVKAVAATRKEKVASEHIGSIGKYDFGKVTLANEFTWETDYGTTHCYKFMSGGDVIVWKSSRDKELTIGDDYMLKGTIKSHSEYRDEKQTLATRCNVKAIG